jgi:hypothetical protein
MTPQEHQVLETAITALHQTTGLDARLLPNMIVEVETSRRKHRFAAEVKTVDRFETPAMAMARWRGLRKRPLLVAPYISREIAVHCAIYDCHLSTRQGTPIWKVPAC